MARSLLGHRAGLLTAAALLLVAVVLTLSACGGSSAAADPLLGTWQSASSTPSSPTMPLTIAKDAHGYVLLFPPNLHYGSLRVPLTRQGDTLTGGFADPRGTTIAVRIVYQPRSGEIFYANGNSSGTLAKADLMRKISESTIVPSPSLFSPSP